MKTVLVTGGSGVLGRPTVQALLDAGAQVRVLSRRAGTPRPGLSWVSGDLLTGQGLPDALRGVTAIIHAASQPTRPADDLTLTRTLLRAAQAARVPHTLYVSIVGVDDLTVSPYYAAKLQAEQHLTGSGLPFSLLRATQFHEFTAYLLSLTDAGPLHVLPRGIVLQPVQVEAVAAELARAALAGPAGRLPDLAGPEVLTGPELARAWQAARGQRRPVVAVPMPLPPMARVLTTGKLVNPQARRAGQTWAEWLRDHARDANPYRATRGKP